MFAVSVITKRYAVAHVTLHSNAAIEKSGFSAFFKGIDKGLTKTRSGKLSLLTCVTVCVEGGLKRGPMISCSISPLIH